MDFLFIFFVSCLLAVGIGFVSFWLCYGLDRMMDYGGFMWKLRFNKFLSISLFEEKRKAFEVFKIENEDEPGMTFAKRIDFLSNIYWRKAADVTSFKLWLCVECMSIRMSLILNIIYTFILVLIFGCFYLLMYFPLNLISASIIYFNVRKNG